VSAFRLIEAEKGNHPISVMCELFGVSASGFHAWRRRAPSDRQLIDAWLLELIRKIHSENRGVYGSPRVHAELRLAHGIRVGRKRVERLMRQAGLSGLIPKRRGRTTIRVPGVRVADDLVGRQFQPTAPNVLWVADITYLRTWEGWLYLCAVQDAFSRRIVGWSMADHMRSDLVVDALNMAIARRQPEAGLIHHSDQGSQGGFKRSSQRSSVRGCDGHTEEAEVGSGWAAGDVLAGSATGGAQGASGAVLGCDRSWSVERGRGGGGGGVGGRWRPVVQGGWRDAAICDPSLAVGALPIVRRAGGDRSAACPELRSAGDRAAARSLTVNDLPRAAS
jgi:Integrase core domain/HTH-like domain